MDTARYLPASRVKAGSLRLGRLTVCAGDGQELGKLAGFVVDPVAHRIRSLIIDSADDAQLEVPMGTVQFDATSRTLRLIGAGAAQNAPFAGTMQAIDDADLWVPFFHTAA